MKNIKDIVNIEKIKNVKISWDIVKKVLVWLVVIMAVSTMVFTIVAVNTFDRNDRSIFGYKAYIVMSDSMSATDFDAGDLIFIKKVEDPSTLVPGDIISYTSQNSENYGQTVTHKIRAKASNAKGEAGFITYGTTTGVDDETMVTYPYIQGKYAWHLPNVGTFFHFLKTIPGYLIFILVPFLLLLIYQGINCVKLFRQYKEEQMEEVNAEKQKLEEERAESQRMMQELMELRARLGIQNGEAPAGSAQVENTQGAVTEVADTEAAVTEVAAAESAVAESVAMESIGVENTVAENIPAGNTETTEKEEPFEDGDLEFIDLDEL